MTRIINNLKNIIPFVIFFMIAIFLWQGLKQDPSRIPSPLVNKPLPHFTAIDLFDPHHALSNEIFEGRVSILNVFATWCLSCQTEHPILNDIHKDSRIELVGLNYKDNRDKSLRWLKEDGNPYDHIINDVNGELGINLGVYGTPETFVIDQKGMVRYKYIGPITSSIWKNQLKPVVDNLLQSQSK